MASLTVSELKKRDNFLRLLNKIKNQEPLLLTNTKQVELEAESLLVKPEEALLVGLEKLAEDPNLNIADVLPEFISGTVLSLPLHSGKQLPTGAFQKTDEFGGKLSEVVFDRESKEHAHLQESLTEFTEGGKKPIRLIVKTTTEKVFIYENVVSVGIPEKKNGISGKSDFELIDSKGRVVAKISHKFGNKAKDFRQWSGIKDFEDHHEIQSFGESLKQYLSDNNLNNDIFPNTLCLGRKLKDEKLKKLAIYGFGDQRVDFLIQGHCAFRQVQNVGVVLTAGFIMSRDEPLDILPESYDPIVLVRRGDLHRGSFGIKGCRGVIYPVNGRKIHAFI